MRKGLILFKRLVAIFLVLLFSINTFAALVGDNDGSAFITKAEFDSIKNNFQRQLDRYNSSIDNKIDGAISSYLAGIKVSSTREVKTISSGVWNMINERFDSHDYTWRYKYGATRLDLAGILCSGLAVGWSNFDGSTGYRVFKNAAPAHRSDRHGQHKLLIQNVDAVSNTADWLGIGYDVDELLIGRSMDFHDREMAFQQSTNLWVTPFRPVWRKDDTTKRQFYIADDEVRDHNFLNLGIYRGNDLFTETVFGATSITQSINILKNKNIILLGDSKEYYNFSNYPECHGFGFAPRPGYDSGVCEKLWQDTPSAGLGIDPQILYGFSDYLYISWRETFNTASREWYESNDVAAGKYTFFGGAGRDDAIGVVEPKNFCWPCSGFEETKIWNWNQIYLSRFDEVASSPQYSSIATTKFLRDGNGTLHVGLKNGLPFFLTDDNNVIVSMDLDLKDLRYDVLTGNETEQTINTDCYVWITTSPFNGYPTNSDEYVSWSSPDGSCIQSTDSGLEKAIKIPASNHGKAKVNLTVPEKSYLWIKWSIDGTYGNGSLILPSTLYVTYN